MKNKHDTSALDAREDRTVRHDLRTVIILNFVLLAALIALFLVNQSSGIVDDLFARLVTF